MNIHFPCSADHEQDWQPYPVDPYSAVSDDHTYIHDRLFTVSAEPNTSSVSVRLLGVAVGVLDTNEPEVLEVTQRSSWGH